MQMHITVAQRRFLILALILTFLAFVFTAQKFDITPNAIPTARLQELANEIGDHVPGLSKEQPLEEEKPEIPKKPVKEDRPEQEKEDRPVQEKEDRPAQEKEDRPVQEKEDRPVQEKEDRPVPKPKIDTNPATNGPKEGDLGMHFNIDPVPETKKDAGIPHCEFPVLIHVTPDEHCTGALALYGSIVRNVLLQPEQLKGKTCVHFTFVDPELSSISEMYKWETRANPYTSVEDCKALDADTAKEYNAIVPVRWQALPPIEQPALMRDARPNWLAALNKVHSWAFDLYPRILLLDADSILITELAQIFLESDPYVTIAGGVDQYPSCHSRSRINGGMILLRPSRYFHVAALELLHDPHASCLTGKWGQSEQELLNCICGYGYVDKAAIYPLRAEFRCEIMKVGNSVWPRNYGCSDVVVQGMRSLHFTASPKPWKVEEELMDKRFDTKYWKCLRDSARKGDVDSVQKCSIPSRDVTRKVTMGGHFVITRGS